MADHEMKKGDLLPSFRVQLTAGGAVVDLTNAVTATFVMSTAAGIAPVIKVAMTIETPKTLGIVRYDWVAGNTDTLGNYIAEVLVAWPGSKPQRFPTNQFWTVTINNRAEN